MIDTKVFDSFVHMGVYVVDKASLIVYYENPLAQRYTGRCRLGEPCYRAHGNDAMCSGCPIRRKDHITLIHRSDYNMVFAVRCEETVWDGHDAYIITVVKQGDSSNLTETEKSMGRMSRALQKTVSVYTEINMETMQYHQMNLTDAESFIVDAEGDYAHAFEIMCSQMICSDDVPELRRLFAPASLHRESYASEGLQEVSARYRMKRSLPERIMECRAIFMRDEVPHYVVITTKDVTREVQYHQRADEMENTLNHVSCGVVIYEMNDAGEVAVKFANERLAKLAECSLAVLMQLFEKDCMFGVDEKYRDDFLSAFRRIAAGDREAERTLYAATYQGNNLWLHVSLTASRKINGLRQIYGTFFDVTADVQAQREFREKYELEKRRRQEDATMLAYGVFDLQSGKVIEMERRKPLPSIAGKRSMEDFCADVCNAILSEEQRAGFAELFCAKNLLRRHEQGMDEQSIEVQRKLPDGRVIWVKSSFRVIADLSQNSILLFYYCNDINIRKNTELMTAYMVDTDYDMIGYINLVDDDAIMLYGENSSRRNTGHAELQSREKYSEALTWFVHHAVVPEERQFYHTNAFAEQVKEKLAKDGSYEFVLHVQDANRGVRTKRIRYTRNAADANSCFFSQVDITDTLAAEEEKQKLLQAALNKAKQANEAKSAFLSRMSHDMRTPMNTIIGLTALSLDAAGITPEIKSNLDHIRGASEFLLGLVNDILDMSKIDAGAVVLKYEPYDYREFLTKLKTMFEPLCREKNITFDFEDVRLSTVIMADKLRVDQVFFNIFSNAVKFTPAGGTVSYHTEHVTLEKGRIAADYVITDTGIGMSPEFLQHIFEPFRQEDAAYTSEIKGTGLGMSIAKRLVELMGGTIRVESKQQAGTRVTVHLGFDLCSQQDWTPAPQAESSDLAILQGKRILLAEDHPLNAKIAQKLLEKKGMVVVHASNGRITVNDFTVSEPGYFDAILMDIRMPEMDGLEAARAIRSSGHPDAKTIPILAMSANAYEEDVKQSLEAGMNAHIAKPIDTAALYAAIAYYLLHGGAKDTEG